MTRLIGTELFKLRKRSMTWILLYVLIGLMIIFRLILFAISQIAPEGGGPGVGTLNQLLGMPSAIPFALSILASLGAVLATILTASSVGNEYNWRTIRLSLISSESRVKFLASKLTAIMIIILIGMVIGVAVGFIVSMITGAFGGNEFDFSFMTGSYLWDQFAQFWRTFFIIMTYSLMGFLFAIIGRSSMPGIAVGIGISFIEPIITSFMRLANNWVSDIPDYLFNANVEVINRMANLPGEFGEGFFGQAIEYPSVAHAFTVLAIYMVVFLVVGFYLFHKRDITG